jgi:hypothetical protein
MTTLTFSRSYVCLSCHETSPREGAAGDGTLWVDCDKCKGPAHWCHSIPCNICEKWELHNIDAEPLFAGRNHFTMKVRFMNGKEAVVDLLTLAMADAASPVPFKFTVVLGPQAKAMGNTYTPAEYIKEFGGETADRLIAAYETLAQLDDELSDLGLA